MAKFMQYVSLPAGRDRVMKGIGMFSVVGGFVVSCILIAATLLR